MSTVTSVPLQVDAAGVNSSENTVLQLGYNRDVDRLRVWEW